MVPVGFLNLRWLSGVVTQGASISHVVTRMSAGTAMYRFMLGWGDIAGNDRPVTASEIAEECRRSFSWEEIVARSAYGLAASGFSYRDAIAAQRKYSELALTDTWPAAIEQAGQLMSVVHATGAAMISEQGLLWLLSEALIGRWAPPSRPLVGEAASRRFARLATIAGSLGPDRVTVPQTRELVHRPPSAALPTTTALLGTGRLVERDTVLRWLVRAVELYDERIRRGEEME